MKLLALPPDPNPYQRLLYGECERRGLRVRYVGKLTPGRTPNLILLPFELVLWRLAGYRILHVHWVFGFRLPGAERVRAVGRLGRAWFNAMLGLARRLGMSVVWTAHNTLPHERVFDDDVAARRTLMEASSLVISHSQAALDELERVVSRPRRAAVIPPGPFNLNPGAARLSPPGAERTPARSAPLPLLFFGKVIAYKGVEELLEAVAKLPPGTVELRVVGQCTDPVLRRSLNRLAGRGVELRLDRRVSDEEATELMGWADAVALPFRRVTTSASALFAMEHGRPLVLPDLPAFAELPDEAVRRYDGSVDGLVTALEDVAGWTSERLAAAGAAARGYTQRFTWAGAAERTMTELEEALEPATGRSAPSPRTSAPEW
jgi:glycosyltransferase involved in cell wall biosynthesis